MDYAERLGQTNTLIEQGLYRQAVETAGGAIEHLLRELYDELSDKLKVKDAGQLRAAQDRIVDRAKPDRWTLGQLSEIYRQGRVYSHLRDVLGYDVRYLNPGTMSAIVKVRNDCAHKNYEPTRAEAEVVRNNLLVFLEETNRAPAEVEVLLPAPKAGRAYGNLPSWTSIAVPHVDIRDRRFDLGTFAVDLGKVTTDPNETTYDYSDPNRFFDLTYMTRGLRTQLVSMLQRLSGDPKVSSVVHLHTTFGGGKTHTLLAMYHLARNREYVTDRDDVRALANEARVETLPEARVAAIDGTNLTPKQPRVTEEGITLHTLWGEIAYQLGGPELYELIRESDEARSAPGSGLLSEMLEFAGPSLILIDELLDYATRAAAVKVGRSYLYDQLQAFLKALSQAVDTRGDALLVLTLTSSVQEQFGDASTRLYDGLKRILGRVERTEVTAESVEIYEILRRRLFESIGDEKFHRQIADAYWDYYRRSKDTFPQHVLDPAYKEALGASYPFHPELVDVLRDRWGTIQGFQKTRGVLRLLALVVSNLYRRNHGAPLIQVGHIDLGDPEIRQELLHYVDSLHGYDSAIGSDIAGLPDSKAEQIDQQIGGDYYRFGLCEGLATSVFMYSHSGRLSSSGGTRPELWLGTLQPDVEPAMAADAFDKLESQLWYLDQEGALSRLGIVPNLNMMLVQRMDAMRQNTDALYERIYGTVAEVGGSKFGKPIIWPTDPRMVKDSDRLKLIISPLDTPWNEDDPELRGQVYVDTILSQATGTFRQFKNTVVFVMPTPEGVDNIYGAAIKLMALDDIAQTATGQLNERQQEDFQRQYDAAKVGLPAAVWGAYLVTVAPASGDPWIGWEYGISTYRTGDTLSQRVWERLKDGERLLEQFDPDFLLKRDDPRFAQLWPAGQTNINVQTLWEYFARYDYLPLLASPEVLQDTIAWGVERGLFAYALGNAEAMQFDTIYFEQRVVGSQCVISGNAWLLEASVARTLLAPEIEAEPGPDEWDVEPLPEDDDVMPPGPRRYAGLEVEARLDPLGWRQFFNSVIQPLVNAGANLRITVRLSADHPTGLDADLIDLRVRESISQIDRDAHVEVLDAN